MNSSSNILQFSTLFDLVYSVEDDRQAIERIFGKRKIIKSKYEEKTTLQRNAKRFMQNGGKLGVGIGILNKTIFRDFCSSLLLAHRIFRYTDARYALLPN